MDAGLKAIRKLVLQAALPDRVEHDVLKSFDELPTLYRDLNRTYNTCYSDRILGLVGGIFRTLASADAGGPVAEKLATDIGSRLRKLHDKHGISVALKEPTAAKTPAKGKVR
jgi:hypothetical protein